MNTLMLTWLSTRWEATAHRAVRRKELGEVECHKWRHHEVAVETVSSAPRTARMVRMVSVPAYASTSPARRDASPVQAASRTPGFWGGIFLGLSVELATS